MNAHSEQELLDINQAWLRKVAHGTGWIIAGLGYHLLVWLIAIASNIPPYWVNGIDIDSFLLLPGILTAVAGLIGGWKITAPEPDRTGAGWWWSPGTPARVLVTAAFLWVAVLVPLRLLLAYPLDLFLVQDVGLALGLLAGAALAARLGRVAMRLPAKALAVETRILGWMLTILVVAMMAPAMRPFQDPYFEWTWLRRWRFDEDFGLVGLILLIWMMVLALRYGAVLSKLREQQEPAVKGTPRPGLSRIRLGEILVVSGSAVALSGVLLGPVAWWSQQQIVRLTAALQHEDPEVRKEAISRFYPYGRGAVAPLVATLQDEDLQVRLAAAGSSVLVRRTGKSAVSPLIELLNDPEARLRRWGATPPIDGVGYYEARPALFELLAHSQSSRRSLLTGDEQLMTALRKASEDEDVMVRYYASTVLGRHKELFEDGVKPGSEGEQLRFWIGHLEHEDPQVRMWAAFHVGGKHKATIPVFAELLKHDNKHIRRWAVTELRLMGPEALEATPALVELMTDENYWLREQAARALNEIGGVARILEEPGLLEIAVPRLLGRLRYEIVQLQATHPRGSWSDGRTLLRRIGPKVAAEVMGLIKPDTGEPVLGLGEVLTEGEDEERVRAALLLGLFGAEAAEAFPVMVEARRNTSHPPLRMMIDWALPRMHGPKAVPALMRAARHHDPEVRRLAIEALKSIEVPDEMIEVLADVAERGDAAAPVAALAEKLTEGDVPSRKRAIAALEFLGEEAAAAVPALAEAMGNKELCHTALGALVKIGPEAIPAILGATNHEDRLVRRAAARKLVEMDSQAGGVAPAVVGALQRGEISLSPEVASLLGQLGPPAKEAVPLLIPALDSKSSALRVHAAFALSLLEWEQWERLAEVLSADVDDPISRHWAIGGLAALAEREPEVNSVVAEALQDAEPHARIHLAEALYRIGWQETDQLVEILVGSLNHPRHGHCAASALGGMGLAASEAVPALIKAKETSKDSQARSVITRTLKAIDSAVAEEAGLKSNPRPPRKHE